MTKTKAQLRAEAVERLKDNSDWAWSDLADFFKASGLMDDPYHTPYRELRSALIDLLTDDCDTECYACSRLAELVAENSQLRVKVDGLTMSENLGSDLGSGSQVCSEVDSREKLEADVREYYRIGLPGIQETELHRLYCKQVLEWLNRQAAITEREREQHWLEIVGASANCNLELTNRIAELQAKVDELTRENARLSSDEVGKQ